MEDNFFLLYNPKERTCILDDGSIHIYKVCSESPDYYNPKVYRCIGEGRIYSIDGDLVKKEIKRYYFWVYVKKEEEEIAVG